MVKEPKNIDFYTTGREPSKEEFARLSELIKKDKEDVDGKKTMSDFWNTISDETAGKLNYNVKTMRNEWERDR